MFLKRENTTQGSGVGSAGRASVLVAFWLACRLLAPAWLSCAGCCSCHSPRVLQDPQLYLPGLRRLLAGRGQLDPLLGKVLPGPCLGTATLAQHGGLGLQKSSRLAEADENSLLGR